MEVDVLQHLLYSAVACLVAGMNTPRPLKSTAPRWAGNTCVTTSETNTMKYKTLQIYSVQNTVKLDKFI